MEEEAEAMEEGAAEATVVGAVDLAQSRVAGKVSLVVSLHRRQDHTSIDSHCWVSCFQDQTVLCLRSASHKTHRPRQPCARRVRQSHLLPGQHSEYLQSEHVAIHSTFLQAMDEMPPKDPM